MSKNLTLEDFQWIIIDKERKEGYYSLKKNGWEITIDWSYKKSWTISVCNRFEEALEEYGCANECEALEIANKIYRSFNSK